jgi:hypothetical protein
MLRVLGRYRQIGARCSLTQQNTVRCISTLLHNANIKPLEDKFIDRKTGIICTVGPSTDSPEMIRELLFAGMGVMRLNFSHGTHEHKAGLIQMLRDATGEIRQNSFTDFSDGRLEVRTPGLS